MLKNFVILYLFIFLNCTSKAQSFGGGGILGISSSQVGGDNLSGFNKAGLLIGIFTNKSISEFLKVQMEITYIQKGSNNPNMNDYDNKNYLKEDISSSYIEAPILLQYNHNEKIKLEGGGIIGFLIDGYYNDSNGKISNYNNINPFINYDFGLILGVTYKYSKKINLNTRISNSILPIGTEDYQNQSTYNSYTKGKYNSVLSFSLYYNLQ